MNGLILFAIDFYTGVYLHLHSHLFHFPFFPFPFSLFPFPFSPHPIPFSPHPIPFTFRLPFPSFWFYYTKSFNLFLHWAFSVLYGDGIWAERFSTSIRGGVYIRIHTTIIGYERIGTLLSHATGAAEHGAVIEVSF